jgi:hypothetical protein
MPIAKPKFSKTNVDIEIDLKKLLGGAAANPEVRQVFFESALQVLDKRTESSRDVNGKIFPKYSKAYKDSLAFAAAGKSNAVNMTLTGDMLGSIQIESADANKMVVGFGSDETENAKAFNHNTGDTVPKREFFGWTDAELNSIAKELRPLDKEPTLVSDTAVLNLIDKILGAGLGKKG